MDRIEESDLLDISMVEGALKAIKTLKPKIKPVPCPKCGKKFYYIWTNERVYEIKAKLMADIDCELTDEEEAIIDLVLEGSFHECG